MDRLAGQIPTGTIVGLIWAGVSEMSCGSIATANFEAARRRVEQRGSRPLTWR